MGVVLVEKFNDDKLVHRSSFFMTQVELFAIIKFFNKIQQSHKWLWLCIWEFVYWLKAFVNAQVWYKWLWLYIDVVLNEMNLILNLHTSIKNVPSLFSPNFLKYIFFSNLF